MISFRAFTTADIPAGLSLCRIAGWNQIEDDWKTFLDNAAVHARVAIDSDKRIAGTVTTIGYGSFSWIGMLLVHPDFRRMGIGSALLEEAMRIIGTETTSRLDATPAGREVYLKLGFHDQYNLIRMVRNEAVIEGAVTVDPHIGDMTKDDLFSILEWDAAVFGADRSFLLSMMLSPKTSGAWIYKVDREIQGYAFCRRGHDFAYVGPLIAKETGVAVALLAKIMTHTNGQKLAIDIPESAVKWKSHLVANGFIEQRPFIRMYRGVHPGDGILNETFAISGPEYG